MTDAAANLKAFKATRKQIKGSLTRFSTYLSALNVPDVSIIELRQRLRKVSELWGSFNEAQAAIEQLEPEEDNEPIHLLERDTFESRYFAVTVELETLIERKSAAEQAAQASRQINITANTSSYREGTPATQASNIPNEHLKLPRVTLPTFSGKYEEWIPFRNMFISMIHENLMLPNVQKMQYLMSALTSEAKDIISSLEASDENYHEAWRMLKDRYNDDSLIIQKHVKALFEQPMLTKENHFELRQLLDNVLKHIRALKAMKRPTYQWDDLLIHLVTSRMDPTTNKEWETTIKRGEIPTFEQLTDFLTQRCRALEASSRSQRTTLNTQKVNKSDKNKGTTAHVATTNIMCAYCAKGDHPIFKCASYLELKVDQRIKEAKSRKLCLNCLKVASHQAKQCGSGSCRKCHKRHNTLLHLEQIIEQPDADAKKTSTPLERDSVISTSVNHAAIGQDRQVILATAVINVVDARGILQPCRALLDNGSQSCFITSKCVKKLGIKQYITNIPIFGVGELTTQTRGLAKVMIQSKISGFQAKLDCLIIEKITQAIPVNRINLCNLQIPDGITLADPEFNRPADVDILLGAEIFLDLLCIGKIKLSNCQPAWQKTLLGWVVSGNLMIHEQPRNATICNLSVNEQLNSSLARFWQLERAERQNTRTPEERICEAHFAQTYKRNSEGRFIVTMPTRPELLQKLGDSKDIALKRFVTLERKLNRDSKLKREYTEFIHEYLSLHHMRELTSNATLSQDPSVQYYLPHHCVIKETSTTTRLRVVFDASSQTTSGISLNDALLVGPVLQQELFCILLRFRSFEYALTADIAKMYRQVLLNEAQIPLQRILWRDQTTEEIKTYELVTLTYGTASASFLATKVIHQLAKMEEDQFPVGAKIASRDLYVDDLITGANSMEEALEIRAQITALLKGGGFALRKWASNSEELLKGFPESLINNTILELDKDGTAKTLGVKWNPSKDVLQYTICVQTSATSACTKRSILSTIAQIFDPLGLLGPVIVTAKIMIQKLWKLQIDWDESLPSDIYTEWMDYVVRIQELNEFKVQRKVFIYEKDVRFEFHGFCDASERAYGACIYVRSIGSHGAIQTHLLCSKSHVAPVRTISIPRLELCGAELLAKLMDKVKHALEIDIKKCYYWTDSSIVLHWIRATNKKLPVFVAHRIGEIQELSTVNNWDHVGSKENPADLVSRGAHPKELADSQLWWRGPSWLQESVIIQHHTEIVDLEENQLLGNDTSTVLSMTAQANVDPFNKFSDFKKLIRVAAMCIRFARICTKKNEIKASSPLSLEEIEYARKCIIRKEQRTAFCEELKALRRGIEISHKSSVRAMNPFLDEDGILRVGGRLEHSELHPDTKHPILLPHHSRLAELIIQYEHKKNLHAGIEATLAAVRLLYWPIRARGTIKGLLRQCITCFKTRPRISEQIMGNLPTHRVATARPFSSTGVDFCGPIFIREGRRKSSKHIKAYVAVLVCMATKAVHLEIVSDLSTDAFLNAFKRFIGRRGKPSDVFSDNGTNFVGANRELEDLRKLFAQEDHQHKIINTTSSEGIKWHFIPPRAPHFGGLWEATVKSFKGHFYKVASEAALTFEEASTLVTQIEAILNSRPLSALSSDPNDLNYLSPGHFLVGSSLTSYPEPDVTQVKINRLSRWQRLEQIRQHFWKRWSLEYLSQLQRRAKWHTNRGEQLKVGQLVLCREDGLPPLRWMLGRVQEVCPGDDNIVRAAVVKTARGIFKRPAVKLSVLPIESSTSLKED